MKNFFAVYVLSVYEPQGLDRRKFFLLNLVLFLIISLPSILATQGKALVSNTGASLWNSWVFITILCVIHLLFINRKNILRFLFLVLYAQNRAIVLTLLVTLLYFPFEYFIVMRQGNYLTHGLKIGSLVIKCITYSYFYFIFFRLVYFFNLTKKPNKN